MKILKTIVTALLCATAASASEYAYQFSIPIMSRLSLATNGTVRVGLICSGVDGNHEDLDTSYAFRNFDSQCGTCPTNEWWDYNGIGTRMAGPLLAQVGNNVGVASIIGADFPLIWVYAGRAKNDVDIVDALNWMEGRPSMSAVCDVVVIGGFSLSSAFINDLCATNPWTLFVLPRQDTPSPYASPTNCIVVGTIDGSGFQCLGGADIYLRGQVTTTARTNAYENVTCDTRVAAAIVAGVAGKLYKTFPNPWTMKHAILGGRSGADNLELNAYNSAAYFTPSLHTRRYDTVIVCTNLSELELRAEQAFGSSWRNFLHSAARNQAVQYKIVPIVQSK